MHRDSTIYKHLGGEDGISGVVDLFYAKILSDERISHFFDSVDMKTQRAHQRDFLIYALGGSEHYMGKSLRKAHARLPITSEHFDIVAEHLAKTLEALHVPSDLIADVLMGVAGTKDDVLNR